MNHMILLLKTLILTIILLHSINFLYCQYNVHSIFEKDNNKHIVDRFIISDTSLFYFPINTFLDTVNLFGQDKNFRFYEQRKKSNLIKNSLYSNNLFALNEPILFNEYNYDTYRFTWLRATHNPISIRIENRNDTIYLFFKRTSGTGGSHPGELINSDTIALDLAIWETIQTKIENINFWETPTIEQSNFVIKGRGVSKWILEGKINDKHHVVYRTNGMNKDIGSICLYFINLSGIKIKKRNFY